MKLHDPVSVILRRKGYDVWSVGPHAPVFEAILRMSQARVGALLVLERGRLIGMISERDYARKVILEGRSSHDTAVEEIMTTPVISVPTTATVDECMQLMSRHRIRHLPVFEGSTVVGVLSTGDLIQWIISAHEGMIQDLNNYISGRYPA